VLLGGATLVHLGPPWPPCLRERLSATEGCVAASQALCVEPLPFPGSWVPSFYCLWAVAHVSACRHGELLAAPEFVRGTMTARRLPVSAAFPSSGRGHQPGSSDRAGRQRGAMPEASACCTKTTRGVSHSQFERRRQEDSRLGSGGAARRRAGVCVRMGGGSCMQVPLTNGPSHRMTCPHE